MSGSGSDRLVKHSAVLMVAAQISAVANLMYHMVLGRMLEAEAYKLLVLALNAIMIVLVPLEAVRTTLAHFSARLAQAGKWGEVRWLCIRWGAILAACGALVLIGMVLGAEHIERFFHIDDHRLLISTATVLAFIFLVPLFVGILQGLQAFYWMSLVVNIWAVLRLLVGTALVYFVAREPWLGMIGQLVGTLTGVLIGCFALATLLRHHPSRANRADGTYTYLGRSLLVLLGYALLLNGDMMVIQRLLPDQADYAARAGTIGRALVMLPMPIALVMFPKVTRSGKGDAATRTTLLWALAMVLGLMALTVGACLVLPKLALLVLYGDRAPSAEMIAMVRAYALAMSPLTLIFLLMNYELAQHRFRACYGVSLAALAFVASAVFFHQHVMQVLLALGITGSLAAAGLAVEMVREAGRPQPAGEKN